MSLKFTQFLYSVRPTNAKIALTKRMLADWMQCMKYFVAVKILSQVMLGYVLVSREKHVFGF